MVSGLQVPVSDAAHSLASVAVGATAGAAPGKFANHALAREGHEARLDHRSLAAQGITDREPEPHLGREQTAMLRRGEPSELGAKVIELRDYRESLGEVEREIGKTRGQIIDLQRAREAREQRMEALLERTAISAFIRARSASVASTSTAKS